MAGLLLSPGGERCGGGPLFTPIGARLGGLSPPLSDLRGLSLTMGLVSVRVVVSVILPLIERLTNVVRGGGEERAGLSGLAGLAGLLRTGARIGDREDTEPSCLSARLGGVSPLTDLIALGADSLFSGSLSSAEKGSSGS